MTALTLSSASTAHRHAVVHRNVSAFYKESYITKTNIVLVEIHRALVVSFPRAPFVSTASSCCIILAVLPRRQDFSSPLPLTVAVSCRYKNKLRSAAVLEKIFSPCLSTHTLRHPRGATRRKVAE